MNVLVKKLIPVQGTKAADDPVWYPVVPTFFERVVINYLRLQAAEGGDTLYLLCPAAESRMTLEESSESYDFGDLGEQEAAAKVIIVDDNGVRYVTDIESQDDGTVTFAVSIPEGKYHVFFMQTVDDENAAHFSLAEGTSELKNPEGFFCGTELGAPVLIHLENAASEIECGMVSCIGV